MTSRMKLQENNQGAGYRCLAVHSVNQIAARIFLWQLGNGLYGLSDPGSQLNQETSGKQGAHLIATNSREADQHAG
jgi:hypothetical protein